MKQKSAKLLPFPMHATPNPTVIIYIASAPDCGFYLAKLLINIFLSLYLLITLKIVKFRVKTINEKVFLEVQSNLTVSGVTQKQINWITIYKNTFVNVVGATLIDSFDKNLPFFEKFSQSVLIN